MKDLPSFKDTKRCKAHCVKSNKECGRKVTHGTKCWFHSQIYDGLRVKKSTIPKAGRGLFAAKAIPKHTIIDKFKGPTLSKSTVDKLPLAHQALCIERGKTNLYTDMSKTNSCYARYANESVSKRKENATLVEIDNPNPHVPPRPALESEKKIKPGQEIQTDYGPEYPRDYAHWNHSRRRNSRRK